MFQFTPLLGAQTGSSSASSSLLELEGGVKVLIDVGWDESFDVEHLEPLRKQISSLSFILLTHATPSHIGAFAHCCKHFPGFTQIPVYATSPVISLGRTLLQDTYASTPLASTIIPPSAIKKTSFSYQTITSDEDSQILLEPPSAEEIASYFALLHPLKYSQPHQPLPSPFSPPLNDLTVTAYNAGHTLGGTIWHIQHGMESIVYAVHWNQVRENVFAGAAWLGGSGGAEVIEQLRKPTALVCSARGAQKVSIAGGRAKRDGLFLDMIQKVVTRGGTVLIPTDTSARVLELAFILERAWRKEFSDLSSTSPFKTAKLYLASRTIGSTMRYAKSMPEWMDESVVREFEAEMSQNPRQHKRGDSKQNIAQGAPHLRNRPSGPFDFRYVKLIERPRRIEKILGQPGPKVILASDSSLEWGFSKDFLAGLVADPNNLVLLTADMTLHSANQSSPSDLRHTLWRCLKPASAENKEESQTEADSAFVEETPCHSRKLHIKSARRIPLEGRELIVYQQYLAAQRQAQDLSQMSKGSTLDASADAADEESSSSSSEESDDEKQGRALNTSATTARFNKGKTEPSREALGVNVLLRYQDVYDYDVRGKKGRDQTFPFLNRRRRMDDFGEIIKPQDYLRAEERDEIDGQDMRDTQDSKLERVGTKRKWQEQGANGPSNDRAAKKRHNRRGSGADANAHSFEDGTANGAMEVDESSSDSDNEPEDTAQGPSKVDLHSVTVEARLQVAFIDFEGVHDQRSLGMLIPLIKPRKLVLVAGDAVETQHLADECRRKLQVESQADGNASTDDQVFTPLIGQKIDASVDTNTWTVKLSEALAKQLHWQQVHGLGVSTVSGHVATPATEDDEKKTAPNDAEDDEQERKKVKLAAGTAEEADKPEKPTAEKLQDLLPILDVLPANVAAATRQSSQPLHVGDLRLADLRKILQATGHTAEFRGEGTLLIDGLVAVRKSGNGRIEVEGGVANVAPLPAQARSRGGYSAGSGAAFHAVKRKIYEGLALIAGG